MRDSPIAFHSTRDLGPPVSTAMPESIAKLLLLYQPAAHGLSRRNRLAWRH